MLNQKTLEGLQKGEYVTCDCFQAMVEEAKEKLSVNNVPPKLACPVSQALGSSTLPYYRYMPDKKRYSTRMSDACSVKRSWTYCPICGQLLRKATEQDRVFWKRQTLARKDG